MKQKNSRWLVVLIGINALLLTAVVMHLVELPQAQAQTARTGSSAGGEYLLLPGKIPAQSGEVVWIVDVNNHLLANCIYNRNRREIQFSEFLDLKEVYESFLIPSAPVLPEPAPGGVQ
ncbi:MAG TPA: hypothetical protein PLQ45_08255 [Anaerohalosphaeraceae bacterium]|nr:hypothetical protein [Anaerohalosphaeraceae bacterium]